MKKLFGVVFVVVSALVVYNYFFGDAQEKQQSQDIINKVTSVGKSVGVLIESEQQKIKEGKYDKIFEKLGDLYEGARKDIGSLDQTLMKRIEKLEKKKEVLQKENTDLETSLQNGRVIDSDEMRKKRESINKELEELLQETDQVLKSIQ